MELVVVGLFPDVDVVVSVTEHPVDEPCELPSGSEDRDRASLVTGDSAEGGAEGRLGTLERCRRHPQDTRDAIGPKTVASLLQGLAPRDGRTRTQAQPRDEMVLRREGGEIGADFGQDHLGGAGTDPVHSSQVDPGKSPESGAGRLLPARLDGFLLGRIGVGGNRVRLPVGRLQGRDLLEQLGLIRGDLGVQGVEQAECRSEEHKRK